jgi:hypothetical protein
MKRRKSSSKSKAPAAAIIDANKLDLSALAGALDRLLAEVAKKVDSHGLAINEHRLDLAIAEVKREWDRLGLGQSNYTAESELSDALVMLEWQVLPKLTRWQSEPNHSRRAKWERVDLDVLEKIQADLSRADKEPNAEERDRLKEQILTVLLHNAATGPKRRMPTRQVAKTVRGSLKHAVSELVTDGLVASRRGWNGGIWLTPQGQKKAACLKSAAC